MWILGPHSNSTESESQELGWESTSQVVLVHINVVKLLIFSRFSKILLLIFAQAMALRGQDFLAWTWAPFYYVTITQNHTVEKGVFLSWAES